MSQYIRRMSAPLTLALALTVAACDRGGDNQADTSLAQDSALSRDLQLAGGDTAAQPALTDVPAAGAPAPAATTPRPAATRPRTTTTRPTTTRPSTPAPKTPERTESGNTVTRGGAGSEAAVGTIAAGTTVALRSQQKVCTNTNKVGDRFTATVAEAITGSNGAVIPAGATAVLEVTSLKKSENVRDNIVVGLSVVSVSFGGTNYAVDASGVTADVERVRTSTKKDDAKKVVGGAIIGAIAGQVIGKDAKGTIIGAATGAAAGAGAAAATGDYDGCINDGSRITFRLDRELQVKTSA